MENNSRAYFDRDSIHGRDGEIIDYLILTNMCGELCIELSTTQLTVDGKITPTNLQKFTNFLLELLISRANKQPTDRLITFSSRLDKYLDAEIGPSVYIDYDSSCDTISFTEGEYDIHVELTSESIDTFVHEFMRVFGNYTLLQLIPINQ